MLRKTHLLLFALLNLCTLFFSVDSTYAQQAQINSVEESQYSYYSVPNDPLKARIYKLENGLTVYMSVYKDAPRIQTYIAVRAGSKNDPSDATGLAHYLEHMLFKGTDKYGTKDYETEKIETEKIENLFEVYRNTKDTLKRRAIYHQIDSISGIAAKYAIANEYDKLLASIGTKGTNAYTWVEQTVYVNDIPSNQLESWLTIEAERYRNPVMRLFHTELEAVYEEKNINLDNDGSKCWEALFAGLFPNHTYGTQTTIGTIDHLKNPSIKKIKEYYNKYYVPNNMAICLSGDFDPDEAIKLIDQKFGAWQSKQVPEFISPKEEQIVKPIMKEVYGPDAETMMMAYRFPGASSKEADMITLIDKILYNGTVGLIDLNLNQNQKVLGAASFTISMKDYSVHVLSADPREGQSLEKVKDLLLSQIELIQKGDFPEWLLTAIINDLKLQRIKEYEDNSNRADAFVSAFILGIDWKEYIEDIDRLSKITKQEIIDFAKKYYSTNNYVVVYKHTGEDKNALKVEKPIITPVEINRNDQSPFLQSIINTKPKELQPVFLNYKDDIKRLNIKNNIPVNYKVNEENNLFNLYYVLDMGTNNDKKLGVAVNYLSYLGTSKFSPTALKQEFYKIGCSYDVFYSEDRIYVSLSGLNENFEKALPLFESLLSDAQPNEEALDNLVLDIIKKRADAKLSKQNILWGAMYNYAKYGSKSPFTTLLTEAELKALKAEELISGIKNIITYEHRILYYGPLMADKLISSLNTFHNVPQSLKPIPEEAKFVELDNMDNKVFVVNYDMKQAEIIMLSKSEPYNKSMAPNIASFNEYFGGGGMSSVVFQDMRESKALAYSVFSSYQTPSKKGKPNYVIAYIGTQADKLPEAMKGMTDLLNEMPESEVLFNSAKEAVVTKLQTERITKSGILFNFEKASKLGLDYDIRKDIYEKLPSLSLQEIKDFHTKYLKGKTYTIMVLGNKDDIDTDALAKYGKVQFLTLEDIFGY